MKIKLITNNPDNPNNSTYVAMVDYCLKQILSLDSQKCIHRVDVRVNNSMKEDGECYTRCLKNSKLVIRINLRKNISMILALVTLAHECVHVGQFVSGRLVIGEFGDYNWLGESYGPDPYGGLTDDEVYEKLPWETEAIFSENDLLRAFIDNYIENNS